ncbi:MAG: hypothetical protein IJX39_01935 [Clostridia bacterium]|nr:hypothetical protein [Clostridia bacterium]
MEKKQLNGVQMRGLVIAYILLVTGILLSCSISYGVRGLSFLIGFSISITGLLYVTNSVRTKKSIANMHGMLGMILIAFGIMFIVNQMAVIITGFIPWGLIAIGSTLLIDAFLIKFIKKDASTSKFVGELIIGAASIALGICLKVISGFLSYAPMMLGIVLIVYAVFMIFNIFNKKACAE